MTIKNYFCKSITSSRTYGLVSFIYFDICGECYNRKFLFSDRNDKSVQLRQRHVEKITENIAHNTFEWQDYS